MLSQARTVFLTIFNSEETELFINFTWNYSNFIIFGIQKFAYLNIAMATFGQSLTFFFWNIPWKN